MECGRQVLLNSKGSTEHGGKLAGEVWVSVGDYSFRESKHRDQVHEIESCYSGSIYGLLTL
jgi:hypothetical protein